MWSGRSTAPSDLGVPVLVFHLTTTGLAAVAAGATAALVLERSLAALVWIIGWTAARSTA